ncbi:MAG: hypothetical protein GTO55_01295, partial [Armatimonadetes bacterium]|nr:hypothetical protein [Armatimonadota bacterium]NIM22912.1 hypothetical protein [Armatimonadota bacterium]NIM66784.1 hypothetical protein [Armatimonadota bacterium]NIM75326.1 hypothetical protein [Armatimonadota bacterium]NIN04972.1 hypothetical protein [Armatimonadota bacterium]
MSPRHRSAALVPLCLTILLAAALLCGNSPTHAATPAGTLIDNQATLEYDGGHVTSNVVSITIAQVAGVSLAPSSASLSGASAEMVCFPVTLTNEGNGTDSFSVSIASQSGWSSHLYRDDNSDGIHQETEQTVISSTGSLGMGQSLRFFATAVIPAGAVSGSADTVTITARSAFDSTVASSVNYSVQVEQTAGLVLDPTQALVTVQPGGKAYVAFNITNIGNDEDTASLSVDCDSGWPAAIIADANKDGVHQDSENTTIDSFGALAPGEQGHAFVEVQVPANLADDTQASVVLKATSALDPAKAAQGVYAVVGKVPPPGDVDGDGTITSLDIEAIAQMAVG